MESPLNKVFYSLLLFILVPLVAYLTAVLIKIICPIAKTPGSFCCPKHQIGDSGEGDAQRGADAEKAGRDEKRIKNALLLLFTIDVNEEKEEEEEQKEIEKAMKRLKERRLRKMRNVIVRQPFCIAADVEDNGKISTAFSPPGKARHVNQDEASESKGVTEEECIGTDSNPVGNIDPTHPKPNGETAHMQMDPIVNNPNDAVSIKENKAASNASLVENIPPEDIPTVEGSGSASKTEPFENGGPSCAVIDPPVSFLDASSTDHMKSSFSPNSTGIIVPVDTSGSRNTTISSSCAVEIVDVKKPKPQRNFSTISSSTVTLVQANGEWDNNTPASKPPIGKSEPKGAILKLDKAKQTASLPVTDATLQKQKDDNSTHISSSSPAINCQATSNNLAHESLPETKASAETVTGNKETRHGPASAAVNPTTHLVIIDISKTENVQTSTKLESVNIDTDVTSLRSIESNTCSNSSERIPRGKGKGETPKKPKEGGQNTAPLKAILVQTVDID